MEYSEKQIESFIERIYDGEISAENLPEDLYEAIAKHLEKAIYEGFGGPLTEFEFGGPDYKMLSALRENVYMFSGAKTFQQCQELQALMIDGDNVLSFKEFKEEALKIYEQYNVAWLEAEYNTAIGQSQSARAWADILESKEELPMLRYSAVVDANTSEICAAIDGVVKSVDDPFWDIYSPLNHYNCRCLLEQLDDTHEETETPEDVIRPDGVFASNPGKSGEVFNKHHPYFDVPSEFKELAKENFGLPIPDEDE